MTTMARVEHIHAAAKAAKSAGAAHGVTLRAPRPDDAEACGRIIYEAFRDINARHGFPPDFPSVEAATQLAQAFIASPAIFGVVAEAEGRVVGSNFLSEGDEIRGVGPITVDPLLQGAGVGRALMEAVIERGRGAAGIRLLQAAFNMRSMSLYAALGFEVREPVLMMAGRPAGRLPAGVAVRPMAASDLEACAALCRRVHGIARTGDLADALRHFAPVVVVRDGRVTGYLTAPTFWIANHGVAETDGDMTALLLGAAAMQRGPLSLLLPTRQAALFRWCLAAGLRAVMPMTLMTMGAYRAPGGAYIPSVLY